MEGALAPERLLDLLADGQQARGAQGGFDLRDRVDEGRLIGRAADRVSLVEGRDLGLPNYFVEVTSDLRLTLMLIPNTLAFLKPLLFFVSPAETSRYRPQRRSRTARSASSLSDVRMP